MHSTNSLTILGNGTCQLVPDQVASAALLSFDGTHLVFDFGRGVANELAKLGLRQNDVRHIVLSHFHPDHLSDLIPYLHAASWSRIDPRSSDLHIYGPLGLRVQLMRILSLFGSEELERPFFSIHLHEISNEELKIEGLDFSYISLPPCNNHGLKFSKNGITYALTGDAESFAEESNFLKGVDIGIIDSGHLDDETIVRLAIESQAKQIYCSHLYREVDVLRLTEQARSRGYKGQIAVVKPLMQWKF